MADGSSQIDLVSGVNTSFLNNLVKDNSFTFIYGIERNGTNSRRSGFHTGPVPGAPRLGIYNQSFSSRLVQEGDTGSIFINGAVNVISNVTGLIVASYDSVAQETTWYSNSNAGAAKATVFNATSTNAGLFTIANESDGGSQMNTDEEWRCAALVNRAVPALEAAAIIAHYALRHNIDYPSL